MEKLRVSNSEGWEGPKEKAGLEGHQGKRTLYKGLSRRLRTSLIAQLVKNPPAVQETPVQFLGWEDPLEKE